MAVNRLETLNNKLADQLSRAMGFAGLLGLLRQPGIWVRGDGQVV